MNTWPDEFRLIAVIVTNALMLSAGWRLARRTSPRVVVALPDAVLYWLAAQYVITGVCGMLGLLWPAVLLSIGCIASAGVLWRCPKRLARSTRADRIAWTAFAFVVAYAAGFVWHQRWIGELATDPIVYHIPAAARWVQDGRISRVDFWYWLPANSYSPLAGSVWIAWWMAPIGNDALSRFVQLPTLLLLFAGSLRLLRDLRVPILTAAIAASTLAISRSFNAQFISAKDDVGVAALAIAVLGGLHARRLREPVAPIRLGLAFGLLISLKYPAILAMMVALPAVLTFRWWTALRLRGTLIAGLISLAFVGPWLVRNAIVTGGNPVYPFFSGAGGYYPDPELRTLAGLWKMLSATRYSPPPTVWILAAVAAFTVMAVRWRRLIGDRDGVLRSILLGPPLTFGVLVLTFPWPEVRYLFPAVAAIFILIGVACACLRPRWAGAAAAAIVMVLVLLTAFDIALTTASGFFGFAILVAAIAIAWPSVWTRMPSGARLGTIAGAALLLLMSIYVWWNAFLHSDDGGLGRASAISWTMRYDAQAEAWSTLRDRVPPGSTIAYANTPMIWPLFGFDLQYRVVYAPVRPGTSHLHDLPPIREKVPARDEYIVVTQQMNEGADAATWLANLERLKADYLFIAKRESSQNPPELRFVAEHADRFETVGQNDAAVLLRVRR